MIKRDVTFDLMRVIGILCIMIDHADPPGWLFQLRNFGTPLLVVTSALTYSYIYENKKMETVQFLKKRLKRLIIPVWMFLTFFFLLFLIISSIFKFSYPFNTTTIIHAFFFQKGFRFLWIFKVYIILAFVTPFAIYYKNRVSTSIYFPFIILFYFLYEGILLISNDYLPTSILEWLNLSVFIVIPYSLLYMYGFKLKELSTNRILLIAFIFFIIFLSLALKFYNINGSFVHTSKYKFPPRIYYFSYALIAIHIIFLFSKYFSAFFHPRIIIWLSSKSLWIYLWHILAYYLWFYLIGESNGHFLPFLLNMFFLLGFGVIITILQTYLVNKFLSPHNSLTFLLK